MPKPKANTKAINLRIELEHEQLVRDAISRIRSGGAGFRTALRALIDDDSAVEFVPAREVHARFGELERKLHTTSEEKDATFLPADLIEQRFAELEDRIRKLEQQT